MQALTINDWIIPATNAPFYNDCQERDQTLQGGVMNLPPNFFNSIVSSPYKPPNFNRNVVQNTSTILPVTAQLIKPQYPLNEKEFAQFMSFFPSLSNNLEKNLIRETLEKMNPESREIKMQWVQSNLTDTSRAHPIIKILTLLSPLTQENILGFLKVVDKLTIPKDEYERLLIPKCKISIGSGEPSETQIMKVFELFYCAYTSKNQPDIDKYERQLQELLKNTTTTNIIYDFTKINEYKVELIDYLSNSFLLEMQIERMDQISILVRNLIREECFSLYPIAFAFIANEKKGCEWDFTNKAKTLFFQKKFIDNFISNLKENRVTLPHLEYHLDYGRFYDWSSITSQMHKALVCLSNTPLFVRDNIIKNLQQKLNKEKRADFEHIDRLFDIFRQVDPHSSEFWREFQRCELSIEEVKKIAEKYIER